MAALDSDDGTAPGESHSRATLIKFFLPSALLTPLYNFGPVTLRQRLPWLKTAFQAGLITTL